MKFRTLHFYLLLIFLKIIAKENRKYYKKMTDIIERIL